MSMNVKVSRGMLAIVALLLTGLLVAPARRRRHAGRAS